MKLVVPSTLKNLLRIGGDAGDIVENTVLNPEINIEHIHGENDLEIIPGFVDQNNNPIILTTNQFEQLIALQESNESVEEIIEQLNSD